uniref:Fe2OG dioxygenase domain-containing protein n=1 Tax=Coccolithus braarudii TaxID=221442 RepID=A0A7S0Q4B7_9EUKA|mmetsp:Transcript_33093/g.70712  ORF Transcript_33093/g.70712 Transcript_33093/m.70712 type:complete len:313 (+) Transcript_33093:85-1023(+)
MGHSRLAGACFASVLAAILGWARLQQDDNEDKRLLAIELEVANGWKVDKEALPAGLSASDRSRFALTPDKSYRKVHIDLERWQGVVAGGEAWAGHSAALSPWAVWTTSRLLDVSECDAWMERAEHLNLETGDFVFAGGGDWGLKRLHTGGRRLSSTRMVEDTEFAALMNERIREQVPTELLGGREYVGVGHSFLVSRYHAGEYFAPHFDGRGSGGVYSHATNASAEFTVVLYLSDDFAGGATHYISGQGSEVAQSVALRPPRGYAAVHRQGTVLHSGGAVLKGTKYIMQFFLYYKSPSEPETRALTNLRWGA